LSSLSGVPRTRVLAQAAGGRAELGEIETRLAVAARLTPRLAVYPRTNANDDGADADRVLRAAGHRAVARANVGCRLLER